MPRSLPLLVPAVLLLAALRLPAAPAAITLAEAKQPRAIILVDAAVLASNSTANLVNPALEEELQRRRLRDSVADLALYLKKMSGAPVALSTTAAPPDGLVPIYIGSRALPVFGRVGIKAPYRQGFRYVVHPKKGIGLYGESALASSYAVYELLDRLGCRWFMPGDRGETIPTLDTLAVTEANDTLAPFTAYRGIWYGDDAYKRRNRTGGLLISAGHALETYPSKEQLAAHPDWVAEHADGRPMPGRLKWSSRPLADAIADTILLKNGAAPQPSVSLSPGDGALFDESAADRALDAGDFDTTVQTNSITDRLLVFVNRIAARVNARQPDLLFGVLAYVQYTRPPVREKVNPSVVPQIAPITYSRSHPMNDDRVPGNAELRAIVEGWGKKAKRTSHYFYGYYLAEPLGPQPMLRKWGHDVPFALERGNCQFWQPETLPNFEYFMHAQYMALRLAWNPKQKPDAIYREINERFYGQAAAEMAAYWDYVDRVWVESPEFSGCGWGHLRRWTPAKLREARTLLNVGRKAAATPDEKFRVELASESLSLFELFMKLRQDQAEGRWAGLMTRADAWHARLLADAAKYKDYATFTAVNWNTNTLGGAYAMAFYDKTYKDAQRVAEEAELMTRPPLRHFLWLADPDGSGEKAGFAKPGFDDSGWKMTDVCTETWSTLGLHNYFKSVWYRTPVTLPLAADGKKIFLWVGSTDGAVKVFFNGREIGSREGYAEPFSFDITAAVKPGEVNHLALLCTRTFFNELGTGGLLAPVAVYREK
jgi:hypothetical protein